MKDLADRLYFILCEFSQLHQSVLVGEKSPLYESWTSLCMHFTSLKPQSLLLENSPHQIAPGCYLLAPWALPWFSPWCCSADVIRTRKPGVKWSHRRGSLCLLGQKNKTLLSVVPDVRILSKMERSRAAQPGALTLLCQSLLFSPPFKPTPSFSMPTSIGNKYWVF